MSTHFANPELWEFPADFDQWGQSEPTQLQLNRAKLAKLDDTSKTIVYGTNILTPRRVTDPKVYLQYPFVGDTETELDKVFNDRDYRMDLIERKSGKRHKYYAKHGETNLNKVMKYPFKRGDKILHYKVGDVEECTLEWCINNANQPWHRRDKAWHNEHRTLPTLAKEANIHEQVLWVILDLDFKGTYLFNLMVGKV